MRAESMIGLLTSTVNEFVRRRIALREGDLRVTLVNALGVLAILHVKCRELKPPQFTSEHVKHPRSQKTGS